MTKYKISEVDKDFLIDLYHELNMLDSLANIIQYRTDKNAGTVEMSRKDIEESMYKHHAIIEPLKNKLESFILNID